MGALVSRRDLNWHTLKGRQTRQRFPGVWAPGKRCHATRHLPVFPISFSLVFAFSKFKVVRFSRFYLRGVRFLQVYFRGGPAFPILSHKCPVFLRVHGDPGIRVHLKVCHLNLGGPINPNNAMFTILYIHLTIFIRFSTPTLSLVQILSTGTFVLV